MNIRIYISGLLILAIILIFLFFPDVLLLQLSESTNLPSGTFITWVGVVSLNYYFYSQFSIRIRSKLKLMVILKRCFQCLVVISFFWGFIGYGFAANWSMTFSGSITTFRGIYEASLYYWGLIYFLFFTPILLFFTALIFKKLRRL